MSATKFHAHTEQRAILLYFYISWSITFWICINFTYLFWHETPHVSDSSSVHHQEFIHCTLSNGICHTGPGCSCSKAVYKPVWYARTPLLSVKWINSWRWTEELSETFRVSCQNKFVKLVHIFGFIIKKTISLTVFIFYNQLANVCV